MSIIMGNVHGEDGNEVDVTWRINMLMMQPRTPLYDLICFLGNSMRMETVLRQGSFLFRAIRFPSCLIDVLELRGSAFVDP